MSASTQAGQTSAGVPGAVQQVQPGQIELASLGPAPGQAGTEAGSEEGQANLISAQEFAARQRVAGLHSQIKHGACRGGFGPKPKKMNATRITPGDPYYIEIRMRQTPLMPVGHTYVAYGNLGPDGNPLDESLIMLAPLGGYAGAALASGVPMPGVLDPHPDDCKIRPEAAYRVSLDAERYERLLREVAKVKQKPPSYLLFTNNCNHFMSQVAATVGLKPPANRYVSALFYIYDMIEANEGYKVVNR